MGSESWRIPAYNLMFSLFLRPISPHDVRLYALRDEIEHSKRFYLSPFRGAKKAQTEKAKTRFLMTALVYPNLLNDVGILADSFKR